jgi:hypothetical protein
MHRLLGDARQRAGDSEGAKSEWRLGLSAVPTNVAELPWQTNERVVLLRRLERDNEAQPLAARLSAMKYRPLD